MSIEPKVYDRNLALKRITSEGGLYNLRDLTSLILTHDNFNEARLMHEKESQIVFNGSETLDDETLFRGLLYSMMTPMQDYKRQLKVFNELIAAGLDKVGCLLKEKRKASEILSVLNYNARKTKYIFQAAENWQDLELTNRIKNTLGKGRESESKLRADLVDRISGLGEKTATLFLRMCGAEHLVPVDTWMITWLYFSGYPIKVERGQVNRKDEGKGYKLRKRGVKGAEYLRFEEHCLHLAEMYDVPGYILQLGVWTRRSTYRATELQLPLFP